MIEAPELTPDNYPEVFVHLGRLHPLEAEAMLAVFEAIRVEHYEPGFAAELAAMVAERQGRGPSLGEAVFVWCVQSILATLGYLPAAGSDHGD